MWKAVLGGSLISAGLATFITARVVENLLLKEFDERLKRELAASVHFLEETGKAEATEAYQTYQAYQEDHKVIFGTRFNNVKPDPEDVVTANQKIRYDKIVKIEGYAPVDTEGELEEEEEEEIYAISTEEFMENESGLDQASISVYADGGVLDDRGEMVVDWRDMIGSGVPPFGLLSGEPHVCYLRNTKLQREFEVVRDDANAADVLAGSLQ